MKKFTHTLSFKVIVLILIPIAIVSSLITWELNTNIHEKNFEFTDAVINRLLDEYSVQIELTTNNVADLAKMTSFIIEKADNLDTNKIFELINNNLLLNDAVYGSAVILNSDIRSNDDNYIYCYGYNNGKEIKNLSINNIDSTKLRNDFVGAERYWFLPKKTGLARWSYPYVDKNADSAFMITYSVPIFKQGSFIGVVTIDILVSKIIEIIEKLGKTTNELNNLSIFLITKDGFLFYFNKKCDLVGQNVYKVLCEVNNFKIAQLQPLIDSINQYESGSLSIEPEDMSSYRFYYNSIKNTKWVFVNYVPENDVDAINRNVVVQTAVMLMVLIFIILIIVLYSTEKLIVNPLKKMSKTTQKIAEGDYSHKVLIQRNDEIGHLANSFRIMVKQLKEREEKLQQQYIELAIANDKLIKLDEAKSEFLKLISHEIRTPLNGIIGSTYFLQEMNKDEEMKEFINMLQESSDRLERFSNNALFLTQLKTGGEMFDKELLNMKQEIDKAIDTAQSYTDSAGVSINKNIVEGEIIGNDELVVKSISEILHNAIKFSKDKQVYLETNLSKGYYDVIIKNNGDDISSKQMEQITQLFGLADSHYDRNTGLGIPITSESMKLMKGKFNIQSSNGEITVTLSFPMK